MPAKSIGKITLKSATDPRLAPTQSAPDLAISDAKVTESAVKVWLSDGRVIITPLSWYPTLQGATRKRRNSYQNLGIGLAWDELDLHLSYEGMLAGRREFLRHRYAVDQRIGHERHQTQNPAA
jgi:Protein of unknown function (DUF2442)